MTFVGGYLNSGTIKDTKGSTDNQVQGGFNNVRFVGDKGANTFEVGGFANNVQIENIGRDERIQLEGRAQDWQQMPDCNSRDGQVTMFNRVTGNTVTLKTDAGRNDCFVKSKVCFTGNYASVMGPASFCGCAGFGGWNNLGNMAMNPNCFSSSSYLAGYLAGQSQGYSQGYGQGYFQGRGDGFWRAAAWNQLAMLSSRAWYGF